MVECGVGGFVDGVIYICDRFFVDWVRVRGGKRMVVSYRLVVFFILLYFGMEFWGVRILNLMLVL